MKSFRNAAEFEAWFTQVQVPVLREHGFPQLQLRGQYDARGAAMALDRKVETMLEKRRWVIGPSRS